MKMTPKLEKVVHALNDKERRSIIYAVDVSKMTVEEISEKSGIKKESVIRQVKVLEESDLIVIDKDKKTIGISEFGERVIKALFLSISSMDDKATLKRDDFNREDVIESAVNEYKNGRSAWKT